MFLPPRLAALLCCLLPISAVAWGPHPEITQAAVDVLPSDDPLRQELGDQVHLLREYCWMADWRRTLRKESTNCFYTDDYLLFPAMPSHVEHICPGVKKSYDPYFRRALQALRNESPANAARWIGSIIHFTEDTGSPPHAAEVLGLVHSKMENWVEAKAIHIPDYQPQLLGETDDTAVAAFQQRMDGLIEFSKQRFERAKPHVLAEDRPGTEPIVLESALECSRVVADLLHTLGVLAAKPAAGGELRGHVRTVAAPGLERMPAKILLRGTLYSTLAEPNGDFVFRHLPAGSYEVVALRGGPPAFAKARIEEGKGTEITLASLLSGANFNLLRNPDFTVNWLGPGLADDWTPLHRKGEEPHFESELVPLKPGMVYRLHVKWISGAAPPDQAFVHLQDKQGLQGLGTDLSPLPPGTEEMSFTADAEHPFAQVFLYVHELKRELGSVALESSAP